MVNSPIAPAGAQLSAGSVDQGSRAGDLLGIALLDNPDPAVPPVDDESLPLQLGWEDRIERDSGTPDPVDEERR